MNPTFATRLSSAVALFAAAAFVVTPTSARGEEPPASPFDGKSLAAWTTQDGKPVTDGWEIVDGAIHLNRGGKRIGHIVTAQEFGDFDLSFEWKIAPGGNSGLKYRVRNYGSKTLGCEYQVFDDAKAKKGLGPQYLAGALYDLYEPNSSKQLKPVGEFNQARIVVRKGKIEHWLNGARIVSATVGDEDWKKRVARSKFSDAPDFSLNERGKLMLTDHGAEVWYRNFVFTQLAD